MLIRNLITLVVRFNFRQFAATRIHQGARVRSASRALVLKRQLVFNATAKFRDIRSICQPDETKIPCSSKVS